MYITLHLSSTIFDKCRASKLYHLVIYIKSNNNMYIYVYTWMWHMHVWSACIYIKLYANAYVCCLLHAFGVESATV